MSVLPLSPMNGPWPPQGGGLLCASGPPDPPSKAWQQPHSVKPQPTSPTWAGVPQKKPPPEPRSPPPSDSPAFEALNCLRTLSQEELLNMDFGEQPDLRRNHRSITTNSMKEVETSMKTKIETKVTSAHLEEIENERKKEERIKEESMIPSPMAGRPRPASLTDNARDDKSDNTSKNNPDSSTNSAALKARLNSSGTYPSLNPPSQRSSFLQKQQKEAAALANEEASLLNIDNWPEFIDYIERAEAKVIMENENFHQKPFLTFEDSNRENFYVRYSTQNLPSFTKRFAIALSLYSLYAVLTGEFFTQGPIIQRWEFAANVMFNLCWMMIFATSLVALRLQHLHSKQGNKGQPWSRIDSRVVESCMCAWLCFIIVLGLFFGNRWRCSQLGGQIDGVSDPKAIFCSNSNTTCKGYSSDADTLLVLVGFVLYLAMHTLLRFRMQCVIWGSVVIAYCLSSLIFSSPEGDRPLTNILLLTVTVGFVAYGQRELEKLHRKQFLIQLEDFRKQRIAAARRLHREFGEEIKIEAFRQKQNEIDKIKNAKRQKKIADLQAAMATDFFRIAAMPYQKAMTGSPEEDFRNEPHALSQSSIQYSLKAMCNEAEMEQDRLTALISQHTEAYQACLPERWKFLAEIHASSQLDHQICAPFWLSAKGAAYENKRDAIEKEAIDYFSLRAEWVQPIFQEAMEDLVATFNAAYEVTDLGLNPAIFPLALCPGEFEVDDAEIPNSGYKHCAMRMGPIKTKESALRKVLQDYCKSDDWEKQHNPRAMYVIDWVRCEVVFADPYCMALFYHLLRGHGSTKWVEGVVRIKPKITDTTVQANSRLNILLNVVVDGFVCEVQLLLYEHSQIKRYFHKYYEILRETRKFELLRPVFHDRQTLIASLAKDAKTLLLKEECAQKDLQTMELEEKCAKLQMKLEQLQTSIMNSHDFKLQMEVENREVENDEDMLV